MPKWQISKMNSIIDKIIILFLFLLSCADTVSLAVENGMDIKIIKIALKINGEETDFDISTSSPLLPGRRTKFLDVEIREGSVEECTTDLDYVGCSYSDIIVKSSCEKQLIISGTGETYDSSKHQFEPKCI
jgi:hypothetical protein